MTLKKDDPQPKGGNLMLGSTKMVRAAQRQVAAAARGQMCAEYIVAWHLEIIQGRDPRVTLRDVDPASNRARRGRPSDARSIIEQIPSLQESMVAMQQLLLRRDGTAPRKEDLEREVAAEASRVGELSASRLAAMGPAKLRILLDAMRTATGLGDAPNHTATDPGGVKVAQASSQELDEDLAEPEPTRPDKPVIDV